jgi:hypothetical protein
MPQGRRGGSNKNTPQDEGDGWAVAGQKPARGGGNKGSPKDEWEVQGRGGRGKQDVRNQPGGKGGRNNNGRSGGVPRSPGNNQSQKPKPKPAASGGGAFAGLMAESSESEEEEEEEEVMETPSTEAPETPMGEVSTPMLMDPGLFEKKLSSILDEFLASSDEVEASECLKELDAKDDLLNTVVSLTVLHVMEKREADRVKANTLLAHFSATGVIKPEHAVAGISSLMEQLPDLAMDVPMFGQYVAKTMGVLVACKGIAPTCIKDLLESVVGTSAGTKLFVWLFDQIITSTSEDQAKETYSQVGMTAYETMHEEDRNEAEAKIVLERARSKNELGWLFDQ